MKRTATAVTLGAVLAGGLALNATPAQAATSLKLRALNVAIQQKGDWYQYGATGPHRFDCSGLVMFSYKSVGKTLPRVAQAQYNKSRKVNPSQRQKGDLVFIGRSSGSIYHVGIYAGFWNGYGWMVDAPRTGRQVGYHKIKDYTDGAPQAFYGRY